MSKNVVYKVRMFPALSESFVLYNIVNTIKSGFDVRIIAKQTTSVQNAAVPSLIEDNQLLDKTFQLTVSSNPWVRAVKGLYQLFRPRHIRYGLRYIRLKRSIHPKLGFEIDFYKQFAHTDVFHVHFADNLDPLIGLKKIGLLKGAIVITFHGYDAHALILKTNVEQLIQDYKRYVSAITVNSNYLKSILLEAGVSDLQISVIPMGIASSDYPETLRKDPISEPLKLITVGRLITLKGQDWGIRLVQKLKEKGVDSYYTIVGEGEQKTNLIALAKELGVDEFIHFSGRLQHSEIKDLLQEQHIFLMTSVLDPDNGRKEAFGLVCVEAQAMGLPVVAFDSGGVKETLINGETGYLIKEQDLDNMVEKVLHLKENSDHYKQMSNNARSFARTKFNVSLLNKDFEKLYNTSK